MSANVILRAARRGDIAAIAKVHVETWRATYAGIITDEYLVSMTESKQALQWDGWVRRARVPEVVLVAEADDVPGGRIIGFGNCGRARGAPRSGEVFTLYVTPDWQGQGIGRRLLAELFTELYAGGLNDAVVWVLSANPSRFFYEVMGGKRIAERPDQFAGAKLVETAYAWGDLGVWLAEHDGKV